jgi:uncharacterized protein
MESTAAANVELIRRAFASDPEAIAESVVWHFQSPMPELVAHFDGREQVMVEWPKVLDDLTGGSFTRRLVEVWPVGDDLVVAHVEVAMTIDGVLREGSSVVVYRIANGTVIEGFDIPSASI